MAQQLSSVDGDYLAVVAIDFGTIYTGYAFSYHNDYQKIYTSTAGGKFTKDRFPTTVLLNPDRSFNSLGFDAESKYCRLADNEEHKSWFYFRRFKMALYKTKKLTRDVTIKDSEGRPMPAIVIFMMAIKNIKDCATEAIGDSNADIQDNDIKWIITVPAIWSDSAKQFMKEAAVQAGIAENQLHLILEPEAASLFCKEEPVMKITKPDQRSEMVTFSEGHKYILADIGGGTADICTHQIVQDGNLRELYRATGGALGGMCVDMAFQQFFIKLIGAEAWMAFKEEYMDEFLTVMQIFDTKKTTFSTKTNEDEVFSIPAGLTSVIQEKLGKTLRELIPDTAFADSISVNIRNKLKISVKVMENFFKPTVRGIINLLKEILAETKCDNIQTLLLVGGFAESPYLREVIKSEMTGRQVIFPSDGSLAVLKGAVLMGYRPRSITERRARFSYGFRSLKPFQEGVHPEKLKGTRNGEDWCRNVFYKVIEKGQVLTCGQLFNHSSLRTCVTKEGKNMTHHTKLYKSTQPDPTYCVEEEGCSLIGRVKQNPPKEGWPERIDKEIQLIVGEAAFTVKVFNKTTREQYEANMDFL